MKLKRGSTTVELLVFIPIFAVIFSLVLFYETRRTESESKFMSEYIAEIRENSAETERAYRERNAMLEASLRGANCQQTPVYDKDSPTSPIEDLGSVRVNCRGLAGTLQSATPVNQNTRIRTGISDGTEDCSQENINC